MDSNRPQGQYRTEPEGDRSPMAYVVDGRPSYVTEAAYRQKGYEPQFDKLPTEAEYDVEKLRGRKHF